ncbi:hypothetical protein Slin14017_G038970 [Septoria linicola]|nr:hypothetical protein Slin14017_G038970 [Septoria linicola]
MSDFTGEPPRFIATNVLPLNELWKVSEKFQEVQQAIARLDRKLATISSSMQKMQDEARFREGPAGPFNELWYKARAEEVFPFFSLPREIRDLIYEAALGEHSYRFGNGDNDIKILASNVALSTALTVSHQFSSEYDERAQALSTLTVSDVKYCDSAIVAIKLPPAVSRISSLHFNISALIRKPTATYQEFDNQYHRRLIRKITGLIPGHRALSIRVELPWEESIDSVYNMLRSEAWTALPNLKSLKAYQTFRFGPGIKGRIETLFEYGPPQNLLLEWSAETGQVERVERIEPPVQEQARSQADAETSDTETSDEDN